MYLLRSYAIQKFHTFNQQAPSSHLTGLIKLNEFGERDFFILQIIQVSPKEHNLLGTWDPENGIYYTRNNTQILQEAVDFIANKTFIVSSILVSWFQCSRT